MATVAVDVAARLVAQGIGVTVVDPRWVKPVDPAIVELAREHQLVVSVEDNGRVGGCGAVLLQTLNDAGVDTPFRLHGIPQEFLGHAKRAAILERIGLDPAEPGPRHRRGRDGTVRGSFTTRCRPHRLTDVSCGEVSPRLCSSRPSSPAPPATASRSPRRRSRTTQEFRAAPDVVKGLTRALAERADAVHADDRAAFLAGVDGSNAAFARQQETYFANLEQLPVGEFGYALDPSSLTRARRGTTGPSST